MFGFFFTTRMFVPVLFIVYGAGLYWLRIITFGANDASENILLLIFTCITAVLSWVLDIC